MSRCPFKKSESKKESTSLYDRLGGVFGIAAVVDRFSDALIENNLVGKNSPNPELRDWSRNQLDRLPGLKFQRTLWVCDVSGGPQTYVGSCPGKTRLGLEKAHCPFKISDNEFTEVARELDTALKYYKVQTKERKQVLAAFAKHQKQVTKCFKK
jgi:hemoglobin